MSYIRCLSNPEGLYVWGDCDGRAYFAMGADDLRSCPIEDFHAVMDEYLENYESNLPFTSGILTLSEIEEDGPNFSKIKLTFSDGQKEIIMWDVTWTYMVNHRKWDIECDRWYRRLDRWLWSQCYALQDLFRRRE